MSDKSSLFSLLELFKSHITAVVTLSTGAIVLSVTFLEDVKPQTVQSRNWLIASWVAFIVAVISGTIYSYFMTLLSNTFYKIAAGKITAPEELSFKNILMASSLILHLSFVAGVVLFFIFGFVYLKNSPIH